MYVVFFFVHTYLLSSFWTSRGHRCRPFSPPVLGSIYIAHRVQQSHCSPIFHRVLLTHAFALSASKFVHKKKSARIYTSIHSGGFEPTKLTYTRLEGNLIRHRGDRIYWFYTYFGSGQICCACGRRIPSITYPIVFPDSRLAEITGAEEQLYKREENTHCVAAAIQQQPHSKGSPSRQPRTVLWRVCVCHANKKNLDNFYPPPTPRISKAPTQPQQKTVQQQCYNSSRRPVTVIIVLTALVHKPDSFKLLSL